jgi:peptide deformylase
MALRDVLQFPDKRLRRVSQPIDEVTDEIRQLAADMLDVMYDEPGIGLAAPQVGEASRLIVVDTEWNEEGSERAPLVLVNPEILETEGSIVWNEGCLSVPDFQADVERAERVRLRATDLDGLSTRSITSTAFSSSTASVASSATCTCASARSSCAKRSRRSARRRRPDFRDGPDAAPRFLRNP